MHGDVEFHDGSNAPGPETIGVVVQELFTKTCSTCQHVRPQIGHVTGQKIGHVGVHDPRIDIYAIHPGCMGT